MAEPKNYLEAVRMNHPRAWTFAPVDIPYDVIQESTEICDRCGADATHWAYTEDRTPTDRGVEVRGYSMAVCDDCDPQTCSYCHRPAQECRCP